MPGANTSTQDKNTNVNTGGWAPAIPSLTNALTGANSAYAQSQAGNAATAPSQFVAGLTPDQVQNFYQMITAGGNTAPASAVTNTSQGVMGAGANGATGALSGLFGVDPNATLNPNAITGAANQYVQGYNIPAEVDEAMRSAREQARDVTLPGIDSMAAGSGNTNSSRAGIATGLVERGLAEQTADLTGSLENQAYGNSLNLASSNGQNTIGDLLSKFGAAGSLGSTLFGQGVGGVGAGIGDTADTLGLGAAGGAGLQQGNQQNINNSLAANQFATQNPFASVDQLMPLILAAANTGQSGSTNTTTTSTPSFLSTVGGLLSAGGSLLGGTTATGGASGALGLLNFLNKNQQNG